MPLYLFHLTCERFRCLQTREGRSHYLLASPSLTLLRICCAKINIFPQIICPFHANYVDLATFFVYFEGRAVENPVILRRDRHKRLRRTIPADDSVDEILFEGGCYLGVSCIQAVTLCLMRCLKESLKLLQT